MNDEQLLELTTSVIFALKPHYTLDQAYADALKVRVKTRAESPTALPLRANLFEKQAQ